MKSLAPHPVSTTLGEWKSGILEGVTLKADDRSLAGCLTDEVAIDELRSGVRISTRSWVGLVRFDAFQVQIVPKLAGENLGLVDLIDYATGLDALERYPSVRTLSGAGANLFDLIALLFAEACERILRGGLLSDYCEVEDDLPVVRGRLLIRQQMLRRFGRIDRLECRYDEHLTNIPENQVLLAGLTICAGRVGHPAVAMRVRRLLSVVSEVCTLNDVDLRQVRTTLVYNRMNEYYREPHELAWLILDALGIKDIYATGSPQCFAFLLDMNKLFENFVARWFRHIFSNTPFRVIPQRRDRTILWDADLNRPYKAVIPDLLVEDRTQPGRFLPVDAKYKLYDERKLSPSDIYQTFMYAYAYGEQHRVFPTALILYPATSAGAAQGRLHVRQSNGSITAEIRAVPIHLPTALKDARSGQIGATGEAVIAAVRAAFEKPVAIATTLQ